MKTSEKTLLSENLCYYIWDVINRPDTPHGTKTERTIQHLILVLSIVTCVLGLAGNVAVIWATGFRIQKQKCKMWFLNLAAADFFFVSGLSFDTFTYYFGNWPLGLFACKFFNSFSVCNVYASIFFITALNVDRVLSVVKPIWHRMFFSRRVGYCICALIWLFTIGASFPIFILSDTVTHSNETSCVWYNMMKVKRSNHTEEYINLYSYAKQTIAFTRRMGVSNVSRLPFVPFPQLREQCKGSTCCADDETLEIWNHIVYVKRSSIIPIAVIGYFIPLCIILVSNILLVLRVHKSHRGKSPRLYKVTVTVVMVYFMTRTPETLAEVLSLRAAHGKDILLMNNITDVLPLLMCIANTNCFINPIIYVFVARQVRSVFIQSLNHVRQTFSLQSQQPKHRETNIDEKETCMIKN
uniref:G-protein coupled receptors family 1 profile domain-containing protein n=1 Tax=Leptobrachium leishanense TaxID=445787 RepID=A0A8C5WFN4_9ANUR